VVRGIGLPGIGLWGVSLQGIGLWANGHTGISTHSLKFVDQINYFFFKNQFFLNDKILDEYATNPRTFKPIFNRAIGLLGQLQMDMRRIKTTPYYLRPPWRKNRYEQIDQSLCTIPKSSSSIRPCAETAKILEEKYNEHIKIYTDGSKKDKKVGCVVITGKRPLSHRKIPTTRSN
jgi:hypothetical protein